MADITGTLPAVRSLAERVRAALKATGEPPNLDEFTPEERAIIRRSMPLYDTDEKLATSIWIVEVASDPKGQRALAWALDFFLALGVVWDGLLVLWRVARFVRTYLGQIVLAFAAAVLFLFDREEILKWQISVFLRNLFQGWGS